jgi:uncharacterized protein (TIGR02145 family)
MNRVKTLLAATLALAITFTLSCSGGDDGGGGGGSGGSCNISGYRTAKIGSQTWMLENLNCDVGGSRCYDDKPENCTKYGRLYDWTTAMNLPNCGNGNSCGSQISYPHQGICPSGWHIPSKAEWDALSSYVESDKGCSNCDAKHLKSTSNWYNNGNGLDSYGFAALPGGHGFPFYSVGGYGYWWSASEYDANDAYLWRIDYNKEYAYLNNYDSKSSLVSVRCLQN